MNRKRACRASVALAFALTALMPSGCIHFPHRTPEMKQKLEWLEQHGHTPDELPDLPRWPWLATLVTIFPPGTGFYYLGQIGNGLKCTLLCWLVYPFFVGPFAAHSWASYENECYFLDQAKARGWFDEDKQPAAPPTQANAPDAPADPDAAVPAAEERPASAPAPAARRASRAPAAPAPSTSAAPANDADAAHAVFCPECGKKVQVNDKFCPFCGGKLHD